MKKNQLTTTKSTNLILGRSKSLMRITKKILESKNKDLAKVKASQELTTHKDITIIGDLMWEKETQEDMIWYEAMSYAENLRLDGYDDWRLPTIEELAEVVRFCGGISGVEDYNWGDVWDKNAANENYQSNYKTKGFASFFYWSSTTNADYTSDAWNVDFGGGIQYFRNKFSANYVRCVRSGQ